MYCYSLGGTNEKKNDLLSDPFYTSWAYALNFQDRTYLVNINAPGKMRMSISGWLLFQKQFCISFVYHGHIVIHINHVFEEIHPTFLRAIFLS